MIERVGLREFIRESNKIEGIHRDPTNEELAATTEFLALPALWGKAVARLVGVYQPGAQLRLQPGMDVRVGNHRPPRGGGNIGHLLEDLLTNVSTTHDDPFAAHKEYETLHPFMDGNGRSGRAIWLWHMRRLGGNVSLGFLHTWYYQSLR